MTMVIPPKLLGFACHCNQLNDLNANLCQKWLEECVRWHDMNTFMMAHGVLNEYQWHDMVFNSAPQKDTPINPIRLIWFAVHSVLGWVMWSIWGTRRCRQHPQHKSTVSTVLGLSFHAMHMNQLIQLWDQESLQALRKTHVTYYLVIHSCCIPVIIVIYTWLYLEPSLETSPRLRLALNRYCLGKRDWLHKLSHQKQTSSPDQLSHNINIINEDDEEACVHLVHSTHSHAPQGSRPHPSLVLSKGKSTVTARCRDMISSNSGCLEEKASKN